MTKIIAFSIATICYKVRARDDILPLHIKCICSTTEKLKHLSTKCDEGTDRGNKRCKKRGPS